MASYFIERAPQPDGTHAVHDRGRCPPARFPTAAGAEYLGEFLHPAQAMAVARVRYPQARGCACCAPAVVALPTVPSALSPLRS